MAFATFRRTAIGILSTGHLPPLLFPPTVFKNITTNAINLVHTLLPDYVLAIDHVTAYYDVKSATFGVDDENNMIIAFPKFSKDHTSKPKTLYEIETVKVPIPDKNEAANSYSEVRYSKPYVAINDDYYIQLRIQELRMYKQNQAHLLLLRIILQMSYTDLCVPSQV